MSACGEHFIPSCCPVGNSCCKGHGEAGHSYSVQNQALRPFLSEQ